MRNLCANPKCAKALADCCLDTICWDCRRKPVRPVSAIEMIDRNYMVWAEASA